ncbi:MAG: dihydrodipicolinate synthase family protein, partial [Bacteroides sp.]|nr:dihydrodipicolinate synthase family protein [Bacteroides sp.]
MASIDISGMGVALITPFCHDKSIDYPTLGALIDYQIAEGADYIVALGTTSENPVLEPEERESLSRFIVERVGGRVPIVRGCGGNSTAAVVRELTGSDLSGYCAVLSVVPYYNKPSQEGIYRHYMAVADASPLPVVLYNVPGRTGVNMSAETTLRLARECG